MATASSTTHTNPKSLLSIAEMKELVSELARAKSRQDVGAILGIYHPDGVLEAPPMGSRYCGADSLRRAMENFFKFAPDYSVVLEGQAVDGDTLCSWGKISFTPQHSFGTETPNGERVTTTVFILFRFSDNRIVWESFHFDIADAARQTGVSASAYRRS
ncbi:ester cyclase [Bradyrhizobium mercantei]|uniref:ester cyclase n=1 Tax=Bradyrhizobium mercantei TaxID=1904807 RepID=UPI0009FB4142|nr:nuclear transport factor 2 family protein [Bradyrhizobium mercantei]